MLTLFAVLGNYLFRPVQLLQTLFPVALIEIAALVSHSSKYALRLLICSVLVSIGVDMLAVSAQTIRSHGGAQLKLLDQYPNLRLREYNVSEFMPENEMKSFGEKTIPGSPFRLFTMIPQSIQDPMPGQLCSFPADRQGLVFLVDSPDEGGSLGRFFFLHELAHMHDLAALRLARPRGENVMLYCTAAWIACTILWSPVCIVLAVAAFALLTSFWDVNEDNTNLLLNIEIDADLFAMKHLPKEDLVMLSKFLAKHRFPADSSLTKDQNLERSLKLKDNLSRVLDSGWTQYYGYGIIPSRYRAAVLCALLVAIGCIPQVESARSSVGSVTIAVVSLVLGHLSYFASLYMRSVTRRSIRSRIVTD